MNNQGVVTVIFKEENDWPYFQDFQVFHGVPTGVKFNVEKIRDNAFRLTAPGYGMIGSYGNGAITVYTNYM